MSVFKLKIIPVTPFQQNCALVWNSETKLGAVVDPGGDVASITKAITAAGVTVEDIFLTHGHLDHAGGATELAQALGVKITGPDIRDKFLLDSLAAQGRMFGVGEHVQNVAPDRWASEGETVSMGGATFEVLHCPGHTPGHVVFINAKANFGIMGDVLFRNSVGRTDFEYGDHAALITAIKEKLMVLPDELQFICGHGQGSSIGAERRSNPYIQ